jgi:PEP-CTERM motif
MRATGTFTLLECAVVPHPVSPQPRPPGAQSKGTVPEPGTLGPLGAGLVGLGLARRRFLS